MTRCYSEVEPEGWIIAFITKTKQLGHKTMPFAEAYGHWNLFKKRLKE
jgi:hypothetical protein